MTDINDKQPQPYPTMPVRAPVKPKVAALETVAATPEPVGDANDELERRINELRGKRAPFGRRTQKLAYPVRPGYHRHWFADHPGRIEEARLAGYEHVKDHEGKTVSKLHGRHRDGRAMLGYLMEIPEVLWKEDLQAQSERVDEGEAAIKQGQAQVGKGGEKQGSFYVPAQGISIKNETKR